jgi:DNA primase large subunit
MTRMLRSPPDLAKYPFTKEARDYITGLNLTVAELVDPDYGEILLRAEQRVEEALLDGEVKWRGEPYSDIEALSYPVAIMIVASIDDDFLGRRYALAEAKRAYSLFRREQDPKRLLEIAGSAFNWHVEELASEASPSYDYALHFVDYLRNASKLRSDPWKLVNRLMIKGLVFLKKDEVARLLSEEVQRYVHATITSSPKIALPPLILSRITRITQILGERREAMRWEELPEKTMTAAYPPCIKRLYDALLGGRHLSHVGRFALTSFFLHVGVDTEELIRVYTSVSDFDERLTRYQTEHIAGKKGSGTKYLPPNCDTLKTHGLCLGPDEVCQRIRHPLSYYRAKVRLIRRGHPVAERA